MSIQSLGLNGHDHIYSPHGEGPQCCQNVKRNGRSVDIVRECLALVAFPNMDATIALHGEPVIPHPQNLPSHGMSIGMRPKGSLMHLFGVHTSKQKIQPNLHYYHMRQVLLASLQSSFFSPKISSQHRYLLEQKSKESKGTRAGSLVYQSYYSKWMEPNNSRADFPSIRQKST